MHRECPTLTTSETSGVSFTAELFHRIAAVPKRNFVCAGKYVKPECLFVRDAINTPLFSFHSPFKDLCDKCPGDVCKPFRLDQT